MPAEQTSEAVFAFAKANLAEGNLNTAKYALAQHFDATLVGAHARALTNNQVAAFAQDLDTLVLFNPGQLAEHDIAHRGAGQQEDPLPQPDQPARRQPRRTS